jgi:HK97 gp10 family phage protein
MAIEFKGLDNVLKAIEDVADISDLENAIGKACALVERSAKQNAHSFRDTGALTNSISSRVEKSGGDIIGVVYTPLEYAPYVEYGTGLFAEEGGRKTPWAYQDDEGNWHKTNGQKPQPFLRPALDDNRKKIIEIIERSVKNG